MRKYITVKQIADTYSVTVQQVYKIIQMPQFRDCTIKVGTGCVRINSELFEERLRQVYRN